MTRSGSILDFQRAALELVGLQDMRGVVKMTLEIESCKIPKMTVEMEIHDAPARNADGEFITECQRVIKHFKFIEETENEQVQS